MEILIINNSSEKNDCQAAFSSPSNGTIIINLLRREVQCQKNSTCQKFKLTPLEFNLFYYLFKNSNQLITRSQISIEVWSKTLKGDQRTIDKHLSSLKKKICPQTFKIEGIHGRGYRFIVNSSRKDFSSDFPKFT